MREAKQDWTDERIDRIIGNLLRIGVATAALVVLAGGTIYVVGHHTATPDYRIFAGEPAELRSVPAIVKGVLTGRSREVIQFGLLLLIATPIARVAFSVGSFAAQRDRTYVIVTLIVLSLLCFSLAGKY